MAENEQDSGPVEIVDGTRLTIDELGPGGPAGVENPNENNGVADDSNPATSIAGATDGVADGDTTSRGADTKPKGWDQVDFQNDDRAAIEARFHRLYGQLKTQERALDQMGKDNRQLFERMQNWEVGQAQQNVHARVNELQSNLQQAMDEGDSQRTSAIVREMAQLEAMSTAQPSNYGAAAPQQPQQPADIEDHPDVATIRGWAAERPWAQQGHKDHAWTAYQLNNLYASPEWADRPIEQKLAQVDNIYRDLQGGQPQAAPQQAPVLADGSGGRGRSRRGGQSSADRLSDAQKTVAIHMFPDKSPRDAYAAYARGIK
jgi:hypothetical protein